MSNNQTNTDLAVAAIENGISILQSLSSKTRNIVYDSTLNKTKIYGHTNFEELNVQGQSVSLSNHNHDSNYAPINHNHPINEIWHIRYEILCAMWLKGGYSRLYKFFVYGHPCFLQNVNLGIWGVIRIFL